MIVHNKIVTEPHLTAIRALGGDPTESIGFGITNAGLGPAVIRRYELRVGAKSFDLCTLDIYEAAREADLLGRGVNVSGMEAGERILAGKTVWTFFVKPQSAEEAKELSERMCRLSATVQYESVYGEIYTLNIRSADWNEIAKHGVRPRH